MRSSCKPPRFYSIHGNPLWSIMPKIWLTWLTGISSRLLFLFPSHFLSTISIPVLIPMNSVYAFHSHGIPMGIPISCTLLVRSMCGMVVVVLGTEATNHLSSSSCLLCCQLHLSAAVPGDHCVYYFFPDLFWLTLFFCGLVEYFSGSAVMCFCCF